MNLNMSAEPDYDAPEITATEQTTAAATLGENSADRADDTEYFD